MTVATKEQLEKGIKIKKVEDLLYSELGWTYCYNCRFYTEIKEIDCENESIPYGCEDCHRKNMGWEISREEVEKLALKISAIFDEKEVKNA